MTNEPVDTASKERRFQAYHTTLMPVTANHWQVIGYNNNMYSGLSKVGCRLVVYKLATGANNTVVLKSHETAASRDTR